MLHRKYRTIFFVIVLGLFLTHIPVSTDSVNLSILRSTNSQLSSEVWSDDFENETMTLNQWKFGGINLTTFDDEYTPNITVSNGMLYSDGPDLNEMVHNSTTTTGTWSLDVFLEDSNPYDLLIVFMSPHWVNIITNPSGYAVYLELGGGVSRFMLGYFVWDPAGNYLQDIDEYTDTITSGWVHIDITRQSDNSMYVHLNGSLRLQGLDTHVSTSQHFVLVSHYYMVFDNITVSDTVDIDQVSPHWTEPLVDQSITEGDDFLYSLHANDNAGLDTWWVADPTHFSIDQQGSLTSVEPLPAGNYSVEVFVNDTLGNVLSGTFNLEVIGLPLTTTTGVSEPLDPLTYVLLAISAGSSVVIIVMVLRIYRFKKPRL